jgi:site-specific DNA-cytosine methylase
MMKVLIPCKVVQLPNGMHRSIPVRTVAFCEIDKKAQAVLRKHWPEVPIYDDVSLLTAQQLAADGIAVDVVCGGFPCQDISCAGFGAGIAEGTRSGLWSEYARIIGELRPEYVIVENVAALLSRGLGRVLGDLASLGYDAVWHCIPATAVGAPHRRDRVWIIAHPPGEQIPLRDASTCGAGQGESGGMGSPAGRPPMTNPTPQDRHSQMIGRVCNEIWANAFGTALVGKPEPQSTVRLDDLQPQLAKLRAPFPANQISKLPKPTKKQTDDVKADFKKGIRCVVCGSWHHPDVVHLDYVGHAALTDRLLDTDINWSWEPVGFTPEGLPALDRNGGLWIKLTVCGVTRYGYGAADGKSGGDAMKEMIGDALRNAAMRFGAALDLWHKGDLHADEDEARPDPPAHTRQEHIAEHKDDPFPLGPAKNKTHLKDMGRAFWRDVEAAGDADELEILLAEKTNVQLVNQIMKALPKWWDGGISDSGESFEGLEAVITRKRRDFEQLEAAR